MCGSTAIYLRQPAQENGKQILGHRWGFVDDPVWVTGRNKHWYFCDLFILCCLGQHFLLVLPSSFSFFLPLDLGLVPLCAEAVLVTQPWTVLAAIPGTESLPPQIRCRRTAKEPVVSTSSNIVGSPGLFTCHSIRLMFAQRELPKSW